MNGAEAAEGQALAVQDMSPRSECVRPECPLCRPELYAVPAGLKLEGGKA